MKRSPAACSAETYQLLEYNSKESMCRGNFRVCVSRRSRARLFSVARGALGSVLHPLS